MVISNLDRVAEPCNVSLGHTAHYPTPTVLKQAIKTYNLLTTERVGKYRATLSIQFRDGHQKQKEALNFAKENSGVVFKYITQGDKIINETEEQLN